MSALCVTPLRARTGVEDLLPLHRAVLARTELVEVLNSLPYLALVVDVSRQIVFANRTLLDTFGLQTLAEVIGRRPGEVLACLHADTHQTQGCGTALECRHCQAGQAVSECLATGSRVTREARVSARTGERLTAYDLRVTATPLQLTGELLAMVYLEDISAAKRREHLETIFLHDLLNSIGSLQLLTDLPAEQRPPQWRQLMSRQVELLADEVYAHRMLARAEHGELQADIACLPAALLIEETLLGLKPLAEQRGVTLAITYPEAPVYLATDLKIARRVVLNAVKNAIEATDSGASVSIEIRPGEPHVVVAVWNPQPMPEAIRQQLFQRSFSTKGPGRGLGTYSMRLLLEEHLAGRVDYHSDAQGTTCLLNFPSVNAYLGGES